MDADQSFQKALLLLDRGDLARGEELLRQVITSTEEADQVLHYRACYCLGELLTELGRGGEAIPLLERVAAVEADDITDDQLDYEIRRARELLTL